MGLPKDKFIELPLLHESQQRGGSTRPDSALCESVAKHFPGITPADLQLTNVSDGSNKWENRVYWVRNTLANKGDIDRSVRGVWAITQHGRDRLTKEWPQWSAQNVEYSTRLYVNRQRSTRKKAAGPEPPPPVIVKTPVIASPPVIAPDQLSPLAQTITETLSHRLEALTAHQFEVFVGKYLMGKGLHNIQVTGRSHDGGIDGNSQEPFLGIKVSFQAKKWAFGQNIGSGPIRELVGSITNRGSDRGLFITTSDFTPGAREEADLSGGKIILINGQRLAQDCIDMKLGIREVVTQAAIDEDFFGSIQ